MRRLVLASIILLLFSCKKSEDTGSDLGYDYYPLEVGNWYIYDVSVTKYNGSPVGKDSSYQMKEEIVEPVTVEDETRYQLYRYYRQNSSIAWDSQPDSVWTVFRRGNQLVKVEDNVRYVKLSFPVDVNRSWDGNSMNGQEAETYQMKEVKRSYTISGGGTTYNPTVTVLHADEKDFIARDYRYEVFAEGVGLVYKHFEVYRYHQGSLGTYTKDVGSHVEQRLVSYGKN